MKLRTEHKIALAFALLAALAYGGYSFYVRNAVANLDFPPIEPQEINLVGIDAGAGYRIIVANEMAQVVQTSDEFGSQGSDEGGATDGAIKKRLPIREMLGSLRGDEESLGQFISIMNDMRESEDWPSVRIIWRAEDLRKALDGDRSLGPRLERDLNMKLDGTPLPSLRPASLQNGIIVDYPVQLTVNLRGKPQQVVGRVMQPYKPRLLKAVEEKISQKQVTNEIMAGYYLEEARAAMDEPARREDIRMALEGIISDSKAKQLAKAPQKILESAEVVITGSHVAGASYKTNNAGDKPRHDLKIDLTEEGQKRLWKYSMNRVGTHLLLIVDGVAIAAPIISHDLTQSELTVRGLPDEVLVRDAVDRLNKKAS